MAEPITSGGSNGSGAGFNIPAPNFSEQGMAQTLGGMEAGWIDDLIRKHLLAHGSGGAALLAALASNVDDLLSVYVNFIGAAQAGGTPGFFTLLSTLLGDLIGVDISADAVNAAWKRGGPKTAFKAVGAAYWKALLDQLNPPATLTPEGGLASAEGFLGYLLGFSIREGNIAFINSVIPEEYRVMDGIDEYAEAMRSSLGLGRMARQALHPMIQTLIAEPLQWYVNKTYKPKLLGESVAVKAFNMGAVDQARLDMELSYAGYDPALYPVITTEHTPHLSTADVAVLSTAGKMNEDSAIYAIRQSGYTEGDAALKLDAERRRTADGAVQQIVTDVRNAFINGYIGPETRNALWSALPLPIIQQQMLQLEADTMAGQPRRRLSLAEVQSAFVEGLLDSTDVSTFLKLEGYSDDDQLTLWYQTLLKLGTQQAKMAVAQYTYDKAKAKAEKAGEPIPPPPAILAETSGIPGLPNL
jgi:hypothetical protein